MIATEIEVSMFVARTVAIPGELALIGFTSVLPLMGSWFAKQLEQRWLQKSRVINCGCWAHLQRCSMFSNRQLWSESMLDRS